MKKSAQLSKAESGAPVQGRHLLNQRQRRALIAMLHRKVWREALDNIAGVSNGPELVSQLRRLGLEVPCERVLCTDRDGKETRPGRYSLSAADRRKVLRWLANNLKGNVA